MNGMEQVPLDLRSLSMVQTAICWNVASGLVKKRCKY